MCSYQYNKLFIFSPPSHTHMHTPPAVQCETVELSTQLSQQADYCSSLGSVCCTLLWRVSRQEDCIHSILSGVSECMETHAVLSGVSGCMETHAVLSGVSGCMETHAVLSGVSECMETHAVLSGVSAWRHMQYSVG